LVRLIGLKIIDDDGDLIHQRNRSAPGDAGVDAGDLGGHFLR
jgi:hypothetical protein